MNTIEKNLNELPLLAMPSGLHERIMRKIIIMKLRTPFLVVLSILSFNLFISSWHLWARLVENETFSIIKIFITEIEFDYTSITGTAQALSQVISPLPLFMFFINIALIGYVSYIGIVFNKL